MSERVLIRGKSDLSLSRPFLALVQGRGTRFPHYRVFTGKGGGGGGEGEAHTRASRRPAPGWRDRIGRSA